MCYVLCSHWHHTNICNNLPFHMNIMLHMITAPITHIFRQLLRYVENGEFKFQDGWSWENKAINWLEWTGASEHLQLRMYWWWGFKWSVVLALNILAGWNKNNYTWLMCLLDLSQILFKHFFYMSGMSQKYLCWAKASTSQVWMVIWWG